LTYLTARYRAVRIKPTKDHHMSQTRFAAAVAAVFAVACANGIAATSAQAQNIVEVAAGAGQFNTLIAAAKAAGLADALAAPGAKTVFAPNDAAFAKLPKGTVATLLKPENKAKLAAILTYHVVGGSAIMAKDIKVGSTHVKTLNGKQIAVKKNGGVSVNGAKVIKADIAASNGVIHVIDKVLLPK
jgi:transforming growth factor-beta-induced protein